MRPPGAAPLPRGEEGHGQRAHGGQNSLWPQVMQGHGLGKLKVGDRPLTLHGMRRLSIPTRIFLGFALLLAAFGAVSVTSVVQHERTAARLLLLHEGYLPLALTVGEAKATQAVFGTLLDRVMSERDPTATRNWLNAARQVRPATLRRALYGVERAEQLAESDPDKAALAGVRTTLEQVGAAYREGDARYDELFDALVSHDDARAERLLRSLRAEERDIQLRLRDARSVLQERIAIVSAEAEEQQRRAAVLLGALTVVGLLLGAAVIFAAHRLLSPLPRLMERVAAVARGDLAAKLEPRTDDELGRLAAEFERMVEALAARDQRLREAADGAAPSPSDAGEDRHGAQRRGRRGRAARRRQER